MASGAPWRRLRWWSTSASPTSANGSRESWLTAASGSTSPLRIDVISLRRAASSMATSWQNRRSIPHATDTAHEQGRRANPGGSSLAGMTNATEPAAARVAFLGPLGTFTEQALLTQPDLAAAELIACRTVPDVLDSVTSGEVDLGF